MSDLINRQMAIDAMGCLNDSICEQQAVDALWDLPSPEKKGKWKPFDLTYGRNIYFCTACNNASEVPTSMGEPVYRFCPWCGASMINEVEK